MHNLKLSVILTLLGPFSSGPNKCRNNYRAGRPLIHNVLLCHYEMFHWLMQPCWLPECQKENITKHRDWVAAALCRMISKFVRFFKPVNIGLTSSFRAPSPTSSWSAASRPSPSSCSTCCRPSQLQATTDHITSHQSPASSTSRKLSLLVIVITPTSRICCQIRVQGGPSGRGTLFVNIKLEVLPQYKLLLLKCNLYFSVDKS